MTINYCESVSTKFLSSSKQRGDGILSLEKTSTDSNYALSEILPDDSSAAYDEGTDESEVSIAYGKKKQTLDNKISSATTLGGDFCEKLREMVKSSSCSRGNKKEKTTQQSKSEADVSSIDFEEMLRVMSFAGDEKEIKKVRKSRARAKKLPVSHNTSAQNEKIASKVKETNECSFEEEQKDLQEKIDPRGTSNEKGIPSLQTKGATSPGLHETHQEGFSEQSAPGYEEESTTVLKKVSKTSIGGLTRDMHSIDGAQQEVDTEYLTVGVLQETDHSSGCSTTAEQAIAQMLREKFSSQCDLDAEHGMVQTMCEGDDCLAAELRQSLRELYDNFKKTDR